MSFWVTDLDPVELRERQPNQDFQIIIRQAYKQVLGNAYLLEGETLETAESLFRNGDLTVRGFVRAIGQSELYRSLFFETCSQYRFIEMNCKHFLGRAPLDQAEISQHVQIYNNLGYEAEIDSYIDSDEYLNAYGENTIPCPRTESNQRTILNVGFNRTYALYNGYASSDSVTNKATLISDLAANKPTPIVFPKNSSGGTPGSNNKRFRIKATKASIGSINRLSNQTYEVNYEQLNAKIKNLHRTGAKILSINEV
ncbi:MAG: photosystem I reaction center subunit XII [Pleurocapsa sp. SU_5_0]|nr:photosystem I reaction center subunit XII [Pleurocapsa sp. SU_5_0]NJO94908.1 photosystem I reaction center subunit XII [Pleurocapsa sp. CRU_1_2]NJR45272.1 photosystem I reaction center subunit XII [Hyellaceae cyanobacterium CSU_1_1]